jgi:hypothetical protein
VQQQPGEHDERPAATESHRPLASRHFDRAEYTELERHNIILNVSRRIGTKIP